MSFTTQTTIEPVKSGSLRLIPGWKAAHRMWSIRIAALIVIITSLMGVWSAFESVLPTWMYVLVGVLGNSGVALARLLDQGLNEQLKDAGQ